MAPLRVGAEAWATSSDTQDEKQDMSQFSLIPAIFGFFLPRHGRVSSDSGATGSHSQQLTSDSQRSEANVLVPPQTPVQSPRHGKLDASSSKELNRAPLRARRPPYQWLARLLTVATVFVVLASVVHNYVIHFGVSGCDKTNLAEEECFGIRMTYITLPLAARQFVVVGISFGLMFRKVHSIRQLRRHVARGRAHPDSLSQNQIHNIAGHWTGAASPDTFQEVANMASENQLTALPTLLLVYAANSVSELRATMLSEEAEHSRGRCCGSNAAEASQCDQLCIVSREYIGLLATIAFGLFAFCNVSFMFLPRCLWSPVYLTAVKTTHCHFMARLLKVPALNFVPAVLFILSVVALYLTTGSPAPWTVFLMKVIFVAFLLGLLFMLWLSGYSVRWEHFLSSCRSICTSFTPAQWRRPLPGDSPGDDDALCRPWLCCHSWRYRQLVVLLCVLVSFGTDSHFTSNSDPRYDLWAARILSLLLLVCKDKEATFDTLETSGAGFGLVANATQLRQALLTHLEGRLFRGQRVKKYKGTLLRMRETLTVSYRWSSEEVIIEGVGPVNMSIWQMRMLVEAIQSTGCLYVWLDCLAVPQDRSRVRTMLLSRMLSVYSSSYLTLALLSCEEDTCRYHQRIWTLQEYCAATSLMICEEKCMGACGPEDLVATKVGEAEEAEQLRTENLLRQPTCCPVWLMDSVPGLRDMHTADVQLLCNIIDDLSKDRHCLRRADKIRALYPMLLNHPADRQEELMQLMQILEDVHGVDQRRQRYLLMSTGHFETSMRSHFRLLAADNE